MAPKTKAPQLIALSAVESEIIHFFVQLAAALSLPKSIGEIFGILFCCEEPLLSKT